MPRAVLAVYQSRHFIPPTKIQSLKLDFRLAYKKWCALTWVNRCHVSLDTESGFATSYSLAAYGLGRTWCGSSEPRQFTVFARARQGFPRSLASALVKNHSKGLYHRSASTDKRRSCLKDRERFCLTDAEVLKLARWAVQIEKHYKKPMDMGQGWTEWQLYIVQARPKPLVGVMPPM